MGDTWQRSMLRRDWCKMGGLLFSGTYWKSYLLRQVLFLHVRSGSGIWRENRRGLVDMHLA